MSRPATPPPGCPWRNGDAESFHGPVRWLPDEFPAMVVFERSSAPRSLAAAWRRDDNEVRPHGSLGLLSPAERSAHFVASASANPSLQHHRGLSKENSFKSSGRGI